MSTTHSDVEHLVSSTDLVKRSGITYRQLDYWTRTGVLQPVRGTGPESGSGYPRAFPLGQVRLARTIRELLDGGLSLRAARAAALQIIDGGHATLGGYTLAPAREQSA